MSICFIVIENSLKNLNIAIDKLFLMNEFKVILLQVLYQKSLINRNLNLTKKQ